MRKPLFLSALMGVAFLMLSSCATTEKSLQERGLAPLTHNELETLMSRTRTTRWTTSKGVTGTGTYTQDGTAKLSWSGGGAEGSWRISGDKFCTTYPTIRKGNETCFTLYKTRENEYQLFFQDGSLNATAVYTN
jgi:hypothetical protein